MAEIHTIVTETFQKSYQIDVDHLFDFNILHDHILDNVREELRNISAFGHHGQQHFHAFKLLSLLNTTCIARNMKESEVLIRPD